jgi:hypothetical protein
VVSSKRVNDDALMAGTWRVERTQQHLLGTFSSFIPENSGGRGVSRS